MAYHYGSHPDDPLWLDALMFNLVIVLPLAPLLGDFLFGWGIEQSWKYAVLAQVALLVAEKRGLLPRKSR